MEELKPFLQSLKSEDTPLLNRIQIFLCMIFLIPAFLWMRIVTSLLFIRMEADNEVVAEEQDYY